MKIITSFSAFLLFVSLTEVSSDGGLNDPVPKKEKKRYVLNYDKHVSLDDLEEALIESGATLERQLSCTRGVVISIGDGYEHLQSKAGFSMLPIASAHATSTPTTAIIDPTGNHRGLSKKEEASPAGCDFVCDLSQNDVDCLSIDDVALLKGMIIDNILLDSLSYAGSVKDSAGELLRLVFHDASNFGMSSMSGLNGCVDMSFGPNAGLQSSITFLAETAEQSGLVISTADLNVLGAIAAVEATGGPTNLPFRFGRKDIPCECQINTFPNPESDDAKDGTSELDNTMRDQLGFTRREIAALMGAHTIGQLEPDKSGYDGGWVRGNERATFDNQYYQGMIFIPWEKTERDVQGQTLTEWKINFPFSDIIMLNTDAVLGFYIDGCDRFGGQPDTTGQFIDCLPREDDYGIAVRDFAASNDVWFENFVSAFVKMTEELVPCMELVSPSMSKFLCLEFIG
jgi:hypothetical protein